MPQRKMPETLGFWIFNLLAMREFHAFRPIFYRTAQAAMCFGQRVNLRGIKTIKTGLTLLVVSPHGRVGS